MVQNGAVASLPTGTVTFLFTDIEGSTRLLQRLGVDYANVLEDHRRLLREAFVAHGGAEVGTEGDSFFVAFPRADEAVAAALDGQLALHEHEWGSAGEVRVRMGLHTGEVLLRGENYVGMAVHIAARIMSAGHGGQVVVSEVTKALAEPSHHEAEVRDLGEHQLKDLAAPRRLFQLSRGGLPTKFPPLRSIDTPRHSLPVDLSTFVGREAERADLGAMLDGSRLTTVVGPGGSGKTRLAVEVARDRLPRTDVTWFVDLVPVRDPGTVGDAIRAAMPESSSDESPAGSVIDAVTSRLGGRVALLVLDNCEHVTDAAAEAVRGLLAGCPTLTVLATGRAPLRITGERVWRLPSLGSDDAIALFSDRGELARPGYRVAPEDRNLVAALCAQLDGNPLALELAAARLAVLTPSQIADRLNDRFALLSSREAPERHRTLAAVVDWSYGLLSEEERGLLRELAIFPSGFEIDAVDAIGDGSPAVERLDLLAVLVDQSLVQTELLATGARYSLLETIREYAAQRLVEADEHGRVEERMVSWCVDLAMRAEDSFQTARETEVLAAVVRERGNLQAGFEAAMTLGRVDDAARIAAGLSRGLTRTGLVEEARDLLLRALAAMSADSDVRASVLGHLAAVRMWTTDEVGAFLDEAITLSRAKGDRLGVARWLQVSGQRALFSGDPEQELLGRRALEESADIFLELGRNGAAAWSIGSITDQMTAGGQFDESLVMHDRALALVADGPYPSALAALGESRARLARYVGDLETAEREATRALGFALESGDEWNAALCVDTLGWVAVERGDLDEAGILLRDALSRLWSVGRWDFVDPLQSLAHQAVAAGDHERAAVFLGGAAAVLERTAVHDLGGRAAAADHAAIVAALGETAAAAAVSRGRAMAEREVVELALGPM